MPPGLPLASLCFGYLCAPPLPLPLSEVRLPLQATNANISDVSISSNDLEALLIETAPEVSSTWGSDMLEAAQTRGRPLHTSLVQGLAIDGGVGGDRSGPEGGEGLEEREGGGARVESVFSSVLSLVGGVPLLVGEVRHNGRYAGCLTPPSVSSRLFARPRHGRHNAARVPGPPRHH